MNRTVPFGVWENGDKIAAFAEFKEACRFAAQRSRRDQCQTGVWANGKARAAYSNGYDVDPKSGRILMNVTRSEATK